MGRTRYGYPAALIVALLLVGCDQQPATKTPAPTPVPNHFQLYTAGSNGAGQFFAWRMNRKTGDLDFCYYDPGTIVGGKPIPAMLNCTVSAEGAGE